MNDIRKIDIPEKDLPLRADVSLLGSLVGEMLVDQHGQDLLGRVERIRKAAILQREGDSDGSMLEKALTGMEPRQAMLVIQAFASYLRAVNLAEKVHRIRRRRTYLRAGEADQRGSLRAVMAELKRAGVESNDLSAAISNLRIQPVFTAHPTEATRRTIQEKEYDIVLRLVERLNPELTPQEEDLAVQRIRSDITSSWQTRLTPHARPSVADELDNILFYITDILYRVVPVFYESLQQAFESQFDEMAGNPLREVLLRFGSWVGGDMDGNPNVTAQTILETLARQRSVIIKRYLPDIRRLSRYLSQSTSEIGVSGQVSRQLQRYQEMMPDINRSIPERHREMPYRCLLKFITGRLEATINDTQHAYSTPAEFSADIELIRESLQDNKGEYAGLVGVERLSRRIDTFGFHLVTLDVRQDALLHRRVMGRLLGCEDWETRDPDHRAQTLAHLLETESLPDVSGSQNLGDEATDTLAVFRAISTARQSYGNAAIGLFIISMTQGPDDVLTAQALSEIANPHSGASSRLDVAPLLETVDDLLAGPTILKRLLSLDIYRQHLAGLGKRQAIMVGYSDSSKDSGIVASRWALHEAQRQLVEVGAEHDTTIVFFHGRGGTVSRGGGNLVNGILGAPPGTVNGFLRVTEQGEVINQKYGVRFLALRNLELVAGATLTHQLGLASQGLNEAESEIISTMADTSRSHFRAMVYEDPGFPDFFRATTPLDVIEQLNIGSRPASRRTGGGIENLRAIPWVFSWAQIRVGFPGVFGFGTALDQAINSFGIENIRDLLDRQVFFQGMINDVEMVLGKSDLNIGRQYAGLAAGSGTPFFETIKDEFLLAEKRILELKRLDALLDDQPVLQRNIRLRNPYVDPLHLMQIDMLRRWRVGGRGDAGLLEALKATVKGIALGIQNTG